MGAGRASPAPHPPTLLPFRPCGYRPQVCLDKTCTSGEQAKGKGGLYGAYWVMLNLEIPLASGNLVAQVCPMSTRQRGTTPAATSLQDRTLDKRPVAVPKREKADVLFSEPPDFVQSPVEEGCL